MRFLLTLWISKLAALIVRIFIKKRGSAAAGKVAMRLQPDFIRHFTGIDYDKVMFVSGTNGKSTTTNMIYYTLCHAGVSAAANTEGANMLTGVATTLIKNSSLLGKFNKEYLILETDERSFPLIRKQLPGRRLGLTNLEKDQVQRNGDPDFILRKIRGAVSRDMKLYLNNEEPRSSSLAGETDNVCRFGVAKNSRSFVSDDFYNVSLPCPICGHAIAFDHYNLASIGTFHCRHCSHRSVPNADVQIKNVDFENRTFTLDGKTWQVPYNNPFYIYNFAMCIAVCRDCGLTDEQIQSAFLSFKNPASHEFVTTWHGKQIHYFQGKQENPEALQSEIDMIAADPRKKAVYVGMHAVTDFYPHYSGSFYFFDCDFKKVVESNVEKYVAFSSPVANDLAMRMILAGAPEEDVLVRDTNCLEEAFADLDSLQTDVIYILTNIKCAPQVREFFQKEEK